MKELLTASKAYRILSGDLAQDRLAHAYFLLFEDERFLRFALKEFAKKMVGDTERKARLIDREMFADCLFFPEAGGKLTAEQAERIVETCVEHPLEGERKLYVLDNMQLANAPSQNKLLKVLEEPPEGVYFLLGTTNPGTALPTVLSRTRQLSIPRFSESEVLSALRRAFPNGEERTLTEAVAASGGIVGKAFGLVEEGAQAAMLQLALRMARGEEPIPVLVRAVDKDWSKSAFLSVLKLVFRDILVLSQGGRALLSPLESTLRSVAAGYPAAALIAAVEHVTAAEGQVTFFANYAQALEILLAKIAKEREQWLKLSV